MAKTKPASAPIVSEQTPLDRLAARIEVLESALKELSPNFKCAREIEDEASAETAPPPRGNRRKS